MFVPLRTAFMVIAALTASSVAPAQVNPAAEPLVAEGWTPLPELADQLLQESTDPLAPMPEAEESQGEEEAIQPGATLAETVAKLPPVRLPAAPVGIRSGLGAVWVSTSRPGQDSVYRIDPRTRAMTRVPRAHRVVAAGPDSLWVTTDNPSIGIRRIDPVSGRVIATVPVTEIRAMALGEGALWASTNAALYRLDPGDARVVGAPVPLEAPSVAMAVGEGGIWVGQDGRETFITRFDPTP